MKPFFVCECGVRTECDATDTPQRLRCTCGRVHVIGNVIEATVVEPQSPEALARATPTSLPWTVWLIAPLLIALIAVAGIVGNRLWVRPLPPRDVETSADKQRAVTEAFAVSPDATQQSDTGDVDEFFVSIGQAYRARDAHLFRQMFAAERAVQEVTRSSADNSLSQRSQWNLLTVFRTKFADTQMQNANLLVFQKCEVRKCVALPAENESLVYVRMEDHDGFSTKMRWWLIKEGDTWRFFDYEDLSTSLRLTDSVALAMGILTDDPRGSQRIVQQNMCFTQAVQAVHAGEANRVEQLLSGHEQWGWPGPLQALCYMLRGSAAIQNSRFEEALDYVRRAEQLHKDMPALYLLNASAHNGLGHWQAAQQAAERYIEQLGDDETGYLQLGIARQGLEDFAGAADAYRKGLEDGVNSVDNLLQLATVLPAGNKAEIGNRFLLMTKQDEVFAWLAESFVVNDDTEALQYLLAARSRNQQPVGATWEYYDAYAHGDWSTTVQRYEPMLDAAGPTHLPIEYYYSYVESMFRTGKALAAYETVKPTEKVFTDLATLAMWSNDASLLDDLVRREEARRVPPEQLAFWKAEASYIKGDYSRAVVLLSENEEAIIAYLGERYSFADRVIRSLIGVGRLDAAMSRAHTTYTETGDPLYMALVYASRGDIEQTMTWLERCVAYGYSSESLFRDITLGPELEKPELKRIRERFEFTLGTDGDLRSSTSATP